ncbi:helix-turn-helix domain-containing protein [Pseudoxanthomonas koreensis]|uniref:helix-turn-helix domain-containing protein n=1 Tax=Pseudoxanthomonas koreensis TaxID=266061 RepID=UPI0035A646BD
MITLTLLEAAKLLKLHPVTVAEWAIDGRIPGAKIGRRWVFIEADLLGYVRANYARRALQGDSSEISQCHSTNARTHRTGGSSSRSAIDACRKALGLPTSGKPRSSTTSEKPNCGNRNGSA